PALGTPTDTLISFFTGFNSVTDLHPLEDGRLLLGGMVGSALFPAGALIGLVYRLSLEPLAIEEIDILLPPDNDSHVLLSRLLPLSCDGRQYLTAGGEGNLFFPRMMLDRRTLCPFLRASDNPACEGDAVLLDTPLPDDATFQWSNGEEEPAILTLDGGTFDVTVDLGCYTAFDRLELQRIPLPVDSFDVRICPGDSFTLPDGRVVGETGVYESVFTNWQGCDSIVRIALEVPPPLTVVDTAILEDHGNASGSILVVVEGGTPPYEYYWSNGAEGPVLTGLEAGTYSLLLTDAEGCQEVFVFEVPLATSLTESSETPHDLQLRPNPVGQVRQLIVEWSFPDQVELLLADALGEVVLHSQARQEILLDLEHLPAGTYVLVLL
ncbi:MAG: hypothetical protein D6765_13195, partial [Bacteroidetes bacterium]